MRVIVKKCLTGYQTIGLSLFSVISLFAILNAVLWLGFTLKDQLITPPTHDFSSRLRSVYPKLSESEIEEIRRETWGRPLQYEPLTQFSDTVFQGKYIHVSKHGFRHSNHGNAWPPKRSDKVVFVFGGSTTFGWGVSDNQTIPHYIQKELGPDFKVYNFGNAYYYSTQEKLRFEKLIKSGVIPDVALFIDGLNEMCHLKDEPHFSFHLRRLWSQNKNPIDPIRSWATHLPVYRAWVSLKKRLSNQSTGQALQHNETNSPEPINPGQANRILSRYLHNQRMIRAISKEYGVKSLFVWQPTPYYDYDRRYHTASGLGGFANCTPDGYKKARPFIEKQADTLWLASIAKRIKKPLYVDQVHYSDEFNQLIARQITDFMRKKISPKHSPAHIPADRLVSLRP